MVKQNLFQNRKSLKNNFHLNLSHRKTIVETQTAHTVVNVGGW